MTIFKIKHKEISLSRNETCRILRNNYTILLKAPKPEVRGFNFDIFAVILQTEKKRVLPQADMSQKVLKHKQISIYGKNKE